jgi:hypothetical protein
MTKSQQEIGQQRRTLKANAEKALRMKRKAGSQTSVPEHEAAGTGAIHEGEVGMTDSGVGRESTWTANLKRSHSARTGDV